MIDPVLGTLAGTIAGGGVSYLAQSLLWKRQDARRFDESLQHAGSRAVEALADLELFAILEVHEAENPYISALDRFTMLTAASKGLQSAIFDLQVAGGPTFKPIADQLTAVRKALVAATFDADDPGRTSLDDAQDTAKAAREALTASVAEAIS